MRKPTLEQLPLHLPLEAASARDDLVVASANASAVAYLDAWPDWPGPVGILAGPVGCGKTHLAHIWAAKANARFEAPSTDPERPPPDHGGCVVVENMMQGAFSETWLFHLFNTVRQTGASLLLTSRRWPGDWGIALPDLRSRLATAHLMEVGEPDDALLKGVLLKLFADRQLTVDASVLDYLAVRMERSLSSAQTLVSELDRLSLSRKRAITRPLAGEALRELGLVG